jgi:hypothetical protein
MGFQSTSLFFPYLLSENLKLSDFWLGGPSSSGFFNRYCALLNFSTQNGYHLITSYSSAFKQYLMSFALIYIYVDTLFFGSLRCTNLELALKSALNLYGNKVVCR